ncbi:MAG TPA: hypothetical protein PLX69_21615 [Leptospiraceae bacterium]|nr:hypothetical protein [Leptospiraceae bacterium]HRG77172.1 hypothetical protein [Leptospiraceae bacterium]
MKRYVGMGDYEKIEVEILVNGWVECAYDWDGGAHNPNRSRMTAREFLDNIPYDVQRLLSASDLQELTTELGKYCL